MELLENITIPQSLADSINAGTLTISDHLLLAAAQFTAALFPTAEIYIGSQQQAVEAPSLFVDYYSLTNQKRLAPTSEYEFGLEITYVPADSLDRRELQNAIFLVQQNLDRLESDVGTFRCFSKDSDITDGLAHVTGIVSVWETEAPDGPIIERADQNIIQQGADEN